MSIELPKNIRKDAMDSIVRYFREHREEEIGNIAAGGLLDFFLEEISPSIYNKAVADILKRMQIHISELDTDFHEEEFQYWAKYDRKRKTR